ncbi:hypothetical protein ACROYT_G044783 [Oculina patagonica]
MNKHCNGPDVSDAEESMDEIDAAAPSPSSKSKSPLSQANTELLQAVRALSDQVVALQLEQKSLREMVEKKAGRIPKQGHEHRNIARFNRNRYVKSAVECVCVSVNDVMVMRNCFCEVK